MLFGVGGSSSSYVVVNSTDNLRAVEGFHSPTVTPAILVKTVGIIPTFPPSPDYNVDFS